MKEIISILHEGNYSCVVRNGGIHTFNRRGVADLFDLLELHPELLKGADVADKAVGKGAAALLVLGGVSGVYADVMSEPALCLLRHHGIGASFGLLVPFMENRTRTGWCPVELLCRDLPSPEECLSAIRDFMLQMRTKTKEV